MYLNEKICRQYYCMQAGSGGSSGNYFRGVRYQRGSGFFGDIFRSAFPLMIKAGKYFGKKLLRAGGHVMSDIASGSSLKDSARARFQETSKDIKDDLFEKLQKQQGGGGGIKKRRRKKSLQSTSKQRRVNNRRKKRKKKSSTRGTASKRHRTSYHQRDIFS